MKRRKKSSNMCHNNFVKKVPKKNYIFVFTYFTKKKFSIKLVFFTKKNNYIKKKLIRFFLPKTFCFCFTTNNRFYQKKKSMTIFFRIFFLPTDFFQYFFFFLQKQQFFIKTNSFQLAFFLPNNFFN